MKKAHIKCMFKPKGCSSPAEGPYTCTNYSYSRPRGYKIFSCSTWLSIKFILLINVKMSHLVANDLSLKKYIKAILILICS